MTVAIEAAAAPAAALPVVAVCAALSVPRASFYRARGPRPPARARPAPPRALAAAERAEILALLRAPEYVDLAPREAYATLLDAGRRLCGPRTMYRLLARSGETRERRDQRVHPPLAKPVLRATGPNQVWSWDITKIPGPARRQYFQLYVVLDVFSRYVVGWLLAPHESAALAETLLRECVVREGVARDALTVHADRGAAMRSKTVAELLADLAVARSHSRPRVSDDNPFVESSFKTLKYDPEFPGRFADVAHGRAFLGPYFDWYNRAHRHEGLAFLTPEDVHRGRVDAVVARRQAVLDAAYAAHPERFVGGRPVAARPAEVVGINLPDERTAAVAAAQ